LNYITNGYPLEAVYLPIDSIDSLNDRDFYLDEIKYPNITELRQTLQKNNIRLVAFIDSVIHVNSNNLSSNEAY
jgi:alpha-glucosidase (family GH31 glycosyl hydrolase)